METEIPGRTIVLCCDGTGNEYGANNTNVVKLFEMLEVSEDQKVYYDPGVGTSSSALMIPFRKIHKLYVQAFGLDLQRNVEDAYYFLMNVYQPGDRIFIFGFSRGAHTARRLAHMLDRVGLLHRGSDNMISYASRMYLDRHEDDIVDGFKRTYCRRCPVHFLGVWDTVSAVSRLLPRPKLDGKLSRDMKFGYHAVAIDEKRLQFPPNLWMDDKAAPGQVLEQVWFAGVHSDVGGFYRESELSDIALRWMLQKAHDAGLVLEPGALESVKGDSIGKKHESWTGIWWFIPHHVYVLIAAVLLLLAQVILAVGDLWWEWPARPFTAVCLWLFQEPVRWGSFAIMLLLFVGGTRISRTIPKNSKVHRSVKERMDKALGYKPKKLQDVIDSVKWVE